MKITALKIFVANASRTIEFHDGDILVPSTPALGVTLNERPAPTIRTGPTTCRSSATT
jgi:hypothetical protein